MAEKPKKEDPREWLKEKLGETDFAEFEKGMRQGAKDIAEGEVETAEVEGQAICTGTCNSACARTGYYWAFQSGYWSMVFTRV